MIGEYAGGHYPLRVHCQCGNECSVELATFFKAAVAQNVRHTGFKTINPLFSITSEYQIHLVTLFTKSASATER